MKSKKKNKTKAKPKACIRLMSIVSSLPCFPSVCSSMSSSNIMVRENYMIELL